MKFLFVSTTFPDATSPGRGTYNAAVCAALARQGHSVRVLSPRFFPEALKDRWHNKRYQIPADLAALGISACYPTYWYTPKIGLEWAGSQMWWSVKRTAERLLSGYHPDAVLSYWAHPDGEVGVRLAQKLNIPSAVIVGGSDVLLLPRLPRRGPRVRDVLLQSDAVITVSEGLRERVCDLGIASERVHTIYQGIDPELFFRTPSRTAALERLGLNPRLQHLVWVGRMEEVKRLPVLIQVADLLKQQGGQFQLHLLGDGSERPTTEQLVSQYDLESQIHCYGSVGPRVIADWFRAADVSVLTSRSEGLPNVLRESLACGTPFVSTDVGSIREIFDRRCTRLVPPEDVAGLTRAIREVLELNLKEQVPLDRPRTWNETAAEIATLFEQLRLARSDFQSAQLPCQGNTPTSPDVASESCLSPS